MNTIAILPEQGGEQPTTFSAVIANRVATGRTAGEALDALTPQLSAEEAASHVIVQHFRPDTFFTTAQRDRLSELTARWRAAREAGDSLPPAEQAELERLIDEEVKGAAGRSTHISLDLERARAGLKNQQREQLTGFLAVILYLLRRIIPRAFIISMSMIALKAILDVSGPVFGDTYGVVLKGLISLVWFAACVDLAFESAMDLYDRLPNRSDAGKRGERKKVG